MKYIVGIVEVDEEEVNLVTVETDSTDQKIIVEQAILQYEKNSGNDDDPEFVEWLHENAVESINFDGFKYSLKEHNRSFPTFLVSEPQCLK